MKKIYISHTLLILLSLILFIGFSTNTYSQKKDIEEMNLEGKVKSIKKNTYEVINKNGEIHKGDIVIEYESKQYFLFDKKGNKIEEGSYKYETDGSINTYTYKYDDKGNKIEKIFYNPDGNLNMKYSYQYDTIGNLIEESDYFQENRINNKYIYKYGDKGNLIETNYSNPTGMKTKQTYKYDDKENLIEEINSTSFSISSGYKGHESKRIYKYDGKGNQIEITFFRNDTLSEKIISKYDDKGNMTEDKACDSFGKSFGENQYKYDDKGNKIEWSYKSSLYGGLKGKVTSHYDDKGNLIEEYRNQSFGLSKKNTTDKYEYDENNNWIKHIVYIKKKPRGIIEREIEYY